MNQPSFVPSTIDKATLPLFDPDFPEIRLLWDATSFSDLLRDPVVYLFKRVEGWDSQATKDALVFGRAYHAALEQRDKWLLVDADFGPSDLRKAAQRAGKEEGVPLLTDKYRTMEALERSVLQYDKAFSPENARPFTFPDGTPSVEVNFVLPIFTPDGIQLKSPSGRPYFICGYFDGLREYNDRLVFWERKHTTTTLQHYLKAFEDDFQILTYASAINILYPDLGIRTGVVDATQLLLKEPHNVFERRTFTFSRQQIEGHMRDMAMWIKVAEVMAVGKDANLEGINGWWPRRRQKWGVDGQWASVLSCTPDLRRAFLGANFDKLEPWNPAIPRN